MLLYRLACGGLLYMDFGAVIVALIRSLRITIISSYSTLNELMLCDIVFDSAGSVFGVLRVDKSKL